MKKIGMAAIVMVAVLGGLTSCTKDNSGTSAASTTSITNTGAGNGGKGNGGSPVGNTRAILESGTWKVTGFSTGQSFEGYAFNFSDDGVVRVTNSGTMYTGSWATTAELQDIIHLEFGEESATLPALNGDWQVVNINANLVQVTGYGGKGGSFSFEKM